ncbi:tRNA pseudouridine synthase B [Deferribacter desulfuricans SSM1]|uniref:tRNA pseudouridine synthase B n=1 Tax=Deferribacter desulfuricans (strain DSM 14783 / JCM 11476 / NBRC 101012 / SSM1) TaxID=639282 RepID=D3PEF9_DEFDS|nr:tRNA pseudouridine(55) synthase TruB [Deferribacter desulfuricans]BAI80982.1 tRNA pseudouridine synthase B [Deferribacter desulfuricans SSM1]
MILNGIVVLYKEKNISSFKAIDKLRKILNVKKCGHTGTLDPIAEGVLPVCLNKATKLIKYLNENEKEYIAELRLGIKTDTFDITGETIDENSDNIPLKEEINNVLSGMIGNIELPVPKFSAVKINGERAYKLARENKDFDAGTRISIIYHIELIDYSYPNCVIKILCSRGTYVRSFINELGNRLGCFATMTNLLRTKSGVFNIKQSYKLEQIEEMIKNDDYSFMLDIKEVLNFPVAVVKDEFLKLAKNGGKLRRTMYLKFPLTQDYNHYFMSDIKGNIFAIAKKVEGSVYPLKIEHVL